MSQENGQINDSTSVTASKNDATRNPPYGKVKNLEKGERYCINKIEIKPGEHMSTQMHYHRQRALDCSFWHGKSNL